MPQRLPADAHAELLSVVLDVLRQHDHVVHRLVVRSNGDVEIGLDPTSAAQTANPLDSWRADKRRRRHDPT